MVEIETAGGGGRGFLRGGFRVFGLGGGVALFFGEEGVLFCFFTGGVGFFGFDFFPEGFRDVSAWKGFF